MLTISPFTKTYDGRRVLSFPGHSFLEGTIIALIGPNGSGKSTFSKVVSEIEPSDQRFPALVDFAGTVGYLPQKPYAFHMSVKKNLLAAGKDSKRMDGLLKELSLEHLANKSAACLSGGETARMALARLFMKDFSLVILDEPCASLDIQSTMDAEKAILSYQKRTGATIFLITHSLKQAERIADEILFFDQGELIEYGSAEKILHHSQNPATLRFLDF